VVEIPLERVAAGRGEPELGLRQAPLEGLRAGDVAGILEFAGVDAEIAVGGLKKPLEIGRSACRSRRAR
jgi:hypothetical protein